MKCTGRNRPMQYGTVDPAHCLAADECPYVTKSLTNADRIRAMSDEELADEILRWFNWLNAVEWDDNRIIEWLKQEAGT